MKSEKIVEHRLQHNDLDVILLGDGFICEIKMAEARRLLEAAKTEEERAKAKSNLEFWDGMGWEAAQWCSYKAIPPIGQLFKRSCGRWHVVLDQKLENKRHSFVITAKYDSKADAVAGALWLIHERDFGVGFFENAHELNWHKIQSGLGERLRALKSCPPNSRAKEAKKLKKDLADAVDRIVKPSLATPRKDAWWVQVKDDKGVLRYLRLEVVVIDIAAKLAKRHQEAPAKGDIRVELCAIFPELKNCKDSTWTNIWKRCGLDELPMAPKWTVAGKTTG